MAFSPADLATAVNDALKVSDAIPADHRGAFLTVVNQDGVSAVLAQKIGDRWLITAHIDHPWIGGLEEGVTIGRSW